MTPRTRLIAALLGGAAVLAAAAWLVIAGDRNEGTSWAASDRTAFMTSCVEQCRKAPGVTEAQYPRCDTACACAADEGEKTMTARELGSAALAISSGTASDEQKKKMDRVTAAGLSCVSAAAPARK
jgi:hypothetical protein